MDQATLKSWLVYHPETGLFTWARSRSQGKGRIGTVAGCQRSDGYVVIKLFRCSYLASRLAMLYMTGEMPTAVDHIDRDPSNNRWTNLRESTIPQNGWNRPKQRNNTSGFKGVTWHVAKQKWQAQINHLGKYIHLGRFVTLEEAAKAYERAAKTLHGEFVCTT